MPRKIPVFFFLLVLTTVCLAKDRYTTAAPIHLDRDGEKWAEKTLRKLARG